MYGVRSLVGSTARSSHVFGNLRSLSPKKCLTTSSDGTPGSTKDQTSSPECLDHYDSSKHEFSATRSRDIVDYGHEHVVGAPSHQFNAQEATAAQAQGIAEMSPGGETQTDTDRADIISHNSSTSVSLNSCMQSNVPEPFNPQGRSPSDVNMPGGGILRSQRYVYGDMHKYHPSKQFSTFSALRALVQPATASREFDIPCPQGIQGDDCVRFKIWYENCRRFNLSNCDEQLSSLQSGRKTLAEVFAEQDLFIRQVVETYEKGLEQEVSVQAADSDFKVNARVPNAEIEDMQGLQDVPKRHQQANVKELTESQTASPQGIQGTDCERFDIWLKNCSRFEMGHSAEQLGHLKSGRKTLSQIFQEQDHLLESVALQQHRSYSTDQKPSDPSDERR